MQGLAIFDDPNLIVGAEGHSDAGVYRLRDDLLVVQSLDFFPPLVDDPFTFGQIAAANSLSDIYAMGADPRTALNIVGFPDNELPLDILHQILQGGAERVRAAGAVVVGGHTVRDHEIKYGLSVTGTVTPEQLITNRAARPGEVLVLTKPLGTGFITTANRAGRCPKETLEAAITSMRHLNAAACQAARAAGVRAATDITGFGLAGHAREMADASGVTLELEVSQLPLFPGVLELVRHGFFTRASHSNRSFVEPMLRVDGPVDEERAELLFDAQTSGGLLLSVAADRADQLIDSVRRAGAEWACRVGRVVDRGEWAIVVRG